MSRRQNDHPGRSPDEQRERLYAASVKRTRKRQARQRWKAAGGESTLFERAAMGDQ